MLPHLLPRMGFLDSLDSKESACNAGELGLTPGSGRPLEKEIATHSNIRASSVHWTEKPVGLYSS